MTSTNTPISWQEFYAANDALIAKIKASGKVYKYIVAIPCGGLMPAYDIAKALGLPVVTINIKSYAGQESGAVRHTAIEGFTDDIAVQADALIVDDIYDSGQTIKYLQAKYPEADTAVTFTRYSEHTATYAGKVLGYAEWVDFPWEVQSGA